MFIKRVHRMSLFVLKSVRYKFGKKEHGYNTCPAILMMETGGHTKIYYIRARIIIIRLVRYLDHARPWVDAGGSLRPISPV